MNTDINTDGGADEIISISDLYDRLMESKALTIIIETSTLKSVRRSLINMKSKKNKLMKDAGFGDVEEVLEFSAKLSDLSERITELSIQLKPKNSIKIYGVQML